MLTHPLSFCTEQVEGFEDIDLAFHFAEREGFASEIYFCVSFEAISRDKSPRPRVEKALCLLQKRKKRALSDSFFILSCGERGIRTPGASQLNGFQDRRNRPLCHLSSKSAAKVLLFF